MRLGRIETWNSAQIHAVSPSQISSDVAERTKGEIEIKIWGSHSTRPLLMLASVLIREGFFPTKWKGFSPSLKWHNGRKNIAQKHALPSRLLTRKGKKKVCVKWSERNFFHFCGRKKMAEFSPSPSEVSAQAVADQVHLLRLQSGVPAHHGQQVGAHHAQQSKILHRLSLFDAYFYLMLATAWV